MNTNKNNFIKIICLIIISFSLLLFNSCSNQKDITNNPQTADYTVFPDEMEGIIKDKNIYVTSIGQDAEMIKFQLSTLEKQSLFDYTIDTFLNASDVKEGSVVFAFVGCSIKALSESSTSKEKETQRANEFIALKQKNDITLIVIHAGGNARRGSTSDSLIELMFSNSNFNIFVSSGNFDGFLTKISNDNNVMCYQIENSLSLKDTVEKLYGVVK